MRRILYIESGETGGGSSESLILNIKYSDRAKYQFYTVFFNETKYVKRLRQMNIPTFVLHNPVYSRRFPYRRRVYMYSLKAVAWLLPTFYLTAYRIIHFSTINKIKKVVLENKIDLIHLNDSVARDLFGVFVTKNTGVPCVSHIRSAKMLSFPTPAQQFANKYVSYYITISDFIKKIWVAWGLTEEKCVTILNRIQPLKPANKDYASIETKKDVTFCTVGRLIKWKNQEWLLKSFKNYLAIKPESRLLIIGDGPERTMLENKAIALGIDNHVTFTGEVESPYDLMIKSDIFVFPSRKEPFGRAVLEAMSLGLPVIASNSGGIPEFIEDGVSGLLVPLNDVEALTEAMLTLSADGKLCAQLAQTAQENATTKFNIEKTTEQIQRIYEQCLAKS